MHKLAIVTMIATLSGCAVVPANNCYYWPYCSTPVPVTVTPTPTVVVTPNITVGYGGPWYNPYYPMSPYCYRRYGYYGWRTVCP